MRSSSWLVLVPGERGRPATASTLATPRHRSRTSCQTTPTTPRFQRAPAANYHSHVARLPEIKSVYSVPIFVLPTFKQFSFVTVQVRQRRNRARLEKSNTRTKPQAEKPCSSRNFWKNVFFSNCNCKYFRKLIN